MAKTSYRGQYKTKEITVTAERDKPTKTDKPKKKLSAFGQAFADARKAGKSTFEWNGKKYTTEMASKKKKKSVSKSQEATEQQTRATSSAPMADRKASSAQAESAFKKQSSGASEIVEAYSEAEKARKKRKGEYA